MCAALCATEAFAQRYSPQDAAYFLHFSVDALRKPVLCNRIDSAIQHPRTYAAEFDSLGRVRQITRLFFGNLDSRADWTIMRFRYDTLPSGSVLVRRTWHNPSGFMLKIGVAHGEDVLYDENGRLLMITAIDNEGNRVERVNAVTRTMYKTTPDSAEDYIQEWRYSNNKQYFGSEFDPWNSQFAELSPDAWFRIFSTDGEDMLTMERPLDLSMEPVPFPGGEMVRRYERNECGQALRVRFEGLDGAPMSDSAGVESISFEYDDAGRLVAWKAFGAKGKPTGRFGYDGAAAMVRSYREFDGALVSEKFLDPAGNPLESQESADKMN